MQIRPDGIALIDGPRHQSWGELHGRIRRLAGALAALGVMPGDRVAMLSLNSHRYVEYYFAVLWAGAAIMPLNHRLTVSELTALIEDGEPHVLIVSPEFVEPGRAIKSLAQSIAHLVLASADAAPEDMLGYEKLIASAEPLQDRAEGGDALACLFYTGGTTGTPKGVMLSHANIFMNSLNLIPEVGMDERTVHLHAGPLFHVAAGVRIYSVSQAGGTHVVAPRFVLPDILQVIEEAKVTLATFVPTMLHGILSDETLTRFSLTSLQYITYGAAPMPRDLLMRAMQRFPHVRFVQSYGMTETSPIVTILGARHHAEPSRLGSAGLPALSAEVRIGTGNSGAAGTIGEIMIRGPMVMHGYWRNPAATAAAFEDGWFRTGDIGYFDDQGFLFVVDRIKDVIISGGENVYSTEVEQALAAHPSVAECAVFGIPDARWGERVHAVIVPRPGCTVDQTELILHCRKQIAGYKLPRSIETRQEPLPTSSVNKILKTMLKAQTLAQLQDSALGEMC